MAGVALQVGSYPFQVVDMWHNKTITGLHTLCDTDPTHTLLERRPVIIAKVTFIYSAGEGWCSLDNEFVHALEHIAVSIILTNPLYDPKHTINCEVFSIKNRFLIMSATLNRSKERFIMTWTPNLGEGCKADLPENICIPPKKSKLFIILNHFLHLTNI